MTGLRVVDSHIHLWDFANGLDYSEWTGPEPHPHFGPVDVIGVEAWTADRMIREMRHADVTKAVFVQVAGPGSDSVAETRWVHEQAAVHGLVAAIVPQAELSADRIEDALEQHLETSALVRGIRDRTLLGQLADSRIDRSLEVLRRADLSWELLSFLPDFEAAAERIRSHPELRVVLDHCGLPDERTPAYFEAWRAGIRRLAANDNLWCKLSGLAMFDHEWTVDSIRPWVLEVLEVFGPGRCMFGGNFPIERLFGSYDSMISAYAEIMAGLSDAESTAVFETNAETFYRI
ncbi:MAG: amidohydrolase family protein [Solirubrobacterales bacterium]